MFKILLAEDEQEVREVAREFLESAGYLVLEARDGAEAMRLAAEHKGEIDLLISDMVMPGMTGQELARRVRESRPDLQAIFMSGYSEYAAAGATNMDPSQRLLSKPVQPNTPAWCGYSPVINDAREGPHNAQL